MTGRIVIHRQAIEAHPARRRPRFPMARVVTLTLVVLVAVLGVTGFILRREPQWRAERVRLALRPGLAVAEAEALLSGRVERLYQVEMRPGWRHLTREAFLASFENPVQDSASVRRLRVTFFGPLGNAVELAIHFDNKGGLREVH